MAAQRTAHDDCSRHAAKRTLQAVTLGTCVVRRARGCLRIRSLAA